MYSENAMCLNRKFNYRKIQDRNRMSTLKGLQCPLKGHCLEQATATSWHFDSTSFDKQCIPNISQ